MSIYDKVFCKWQRVINEFMYASKAPRITLHKPTNTGEIDLPDLLGILL